MKTIAGWIKSLFAGQKEWPLESLPNENGSVDILYAVSGQQIRGFESPSYSTLPEDYGLKLECDLSKGLLVGPGLTVKVFRRRDDAVNFAYHCNLVTVTNPVYRLKNEQWEYSNELTSSLASEIA